MLEVRPAGVLLLALGCFVTAACSRGADDPVEDVAQQTAETPVEAFFRYGPTVRADTRADLLAALGRPDSIGVAAVANRHDQGVTDTVFTVHYPGLEAEFYRVTLDGRELPSALVISDNRHLRAESPVRLGQPRSELLLLLGEPDETSEGALGYTCRTCDAAGYDRLELELAEDALRRIVLRYWLD